MFGKINKRIAQEVITEGLLDCKKSGDLSYIAGLATMARELGLITQKQYNDYTTLAANKINAAAKQRREQQAQLAAERKEKAKAAKQNI